MKRIPVVYVLAVARRHGTTAAATWSGRSTGNVADLRQRHDGYQRGRGRPSVVELEAWADRPDCRCPKHLGVDKVDRLIAGMYELRYGASTIGRLVGLTGAEVRKRIVDMQAPSIQRWTSIGRSA